MSMRWGLLLATLLGLSAPAAAHLTPNSEVQLDIGDGSVSTDIIVPQGEYAYATGNPVDGGAQSRAIARRYLHEHITVRSPDGRPWQVRVGKVEFVEIAGPPDLHALATFTAPADAPARRFTIEWRVLVNELPSHFALFVAHRPDGSRDILGAVRHGRVELTVDRAQSGASAFGSAIGLGARHILTGYDHLMFLLALLLPAPLLAANGRWRGRRTAKATFGQLAKIVTAFTIGHSLTLIGATLGGWTLPTAPVEIAIAVSVLVSAIHALRPLFPGREPVVAGAFGLVHGLAFATLVREADAGMASSALSLFGFNLGIELVQLVIVCAALPSLLILSRTETYRYLRTGAAGFCAVAAATWIGARTGALPDAAALAMEAVIRQLGWVALALSLIVVVGWLVGRRRSPSPLAVS